MVRNHRLFFLLISSAVVTLITACAPRTPVPAQQGDFPQPTQTVLADIPPSPTPKPPFVAPFPESLTIAELGERLNPFNDADCPLPCYIGLTPGEGDVEDAMIFYSKIGIGEDDFIPGDYQNLQEEASHLGAWLQRSTDIVQAQESGYKPPLVDVYLEARRVQYLYIGWTTYPDYLSLEEVINNLGTPDEISLGLVFKDDPIYLLQFVYTDDRFGVFYAGRLVEDGANKKLCFSSEEINVTYLGVFAPEQVPMDGLQGSEFLLPFEDIIGTSYDDFIQSINEGECLSIPPHQFEVWQNLKPEN